MADMLHGGEIYNSTKINYDFSVNINPLGIPENVLRSLRENLSLLTQYPDQACRELRLALERHTGVPARQILCGNGASELIEAAVGGLHVQKILLTAPSFSGYRHAAWSHGCEILYHELRREENFALTDRYLEDLAQGPDLAILCSPANPVGNLIDPELLLRIAGACERQGTWLLVDECFLGFLPDEKQRTMRRYLIPGGACAKRNGIRECRPDDPEEEPRKISQETSQETFQEVSQKVFQETFQEASRETSQEVSQKVFQEASRETSQEAPQETFQEVSQEASQVEGTVESRKGVFRHLLVLDAFTKRFAMPGIRLGTLMAADPEILAAIHARQPEWSVSIPAQTAGLAALETGEGYMEKARALVASERKRMVSSLERCGCRVFPGEANYIFFSSETELYEPLLQRGILIRRCDNYPGLRRGDYRAAVLRPEENRVLLEALTEICERKNPPTDDGL